LGLSETRILGVKRLLSLTLRCAVVAMFSLAAVANTQAQGANSATTPGTGVLLTKLLPPVYPPLARLARIAGDVQVQVLIRKDGSVASAKVISGHPILDPAALESAQKSTFECRECDAELALYSLTYTFVIEGADCNYRRARSAKCFYLWKCGDWHQVTERHTPEVTQSPSHIRIVATAPCFEAIQAATALK
jgi:TonB family protein